MVVVLAALFSCVQTLPIVAQDRQRVRIKAVFDGDTVLTEKGRKIRLVGVDTPELGRAHRPGMPFSKAAKKFLAKLVKGRVSEFEPALQSRDKYDRSLGYLFINGRSVNLEILKAGLGRVYLIGPNTRYGEQFIKAEREARKAKRGLWSKMKKGWTR